MTISFEFKLYECLRSIQIVPDHLFIELFELLAFFNFVWLFQNTFVIITLFSIFIQFTTQQNSLQKKAVGNVFQVQLSKSFA